MKNNLQNSTQTGSYIELFYTITSFIKLNISTFLDSYFFCIFFSPSVLSQDYLDKVLFHTLINLTSTYCFVNLKFVSTYNLKTFSISLIELYLFDSSSNNTISEIVTMLVVFLFSKCINLDFYITLFNFFYSLVLKYSQLIQYNLLIDQINKQITFCSSLYKNQVSLYIIANILLATLSISNNSLYLLNSIISILTFEIFIFILGDLILLLLILQLFSIQQNFQASVISKSIFTLLSSVVVTTSLKMTNNILSKLIGEVFYGNHKRIQQGVFNILFILHIYSSY